MTLPNFLIIGAEKAGTTWLYRQLRSHPEIYMPNTKEVHFFNKYTSQLKERDRYANKDLAFYERYFTKVSGETAVGEATPMYLCDPEAPKRIWKTLGEDVQLVASLRDPVDRAYSHYWMACRKGREARSFAEVIAAEDRRIVQRGLYGKQIRRYLEYYDPESLYVVEFRKLFRNQSEQLRKLCLSLGVEPEVFDGEGMEKNRVVHGSSRIRSTMLLDVVSWTASQLRGTPGLFWLAEAFNKLRIGATIRRLNRKREDYPPLDPDTADALAAYYQEDVALLHDLVDLDLSAWRSQAG